MKRRTLLAATAASGLAAMPFAAMAQAYPSKPITVVVPFAAGGPTDALARILCQRMGEALGQQMIVENVGGAGGTIGVAKVARAAPDGYTLELHPHGHARGQHRALQVAALRQPEGLRAGRARRHQPDGAGHQEGPAGQDLPGVPGLREGQREEGAVRHGRHRRRARPERVEGEGDGAPRRCRLRRAAPASPCAPTSRCRRRRSSARHRARPGDWGRAPWPPRRPC